MGFWGLFEVASMPILQVLIVSAIGAFMATDYLNLLPTNTRNSLNKIVFVIFTPSLIFASLVETVTFEDIISWLGFEIVYQGSSGNEAKKDGSFSDRLVEILKKLLEQLLAPPTLGSGWNHTLSHSYIRRKPHTRSTKGKHGAHDRYDGHHCSLLDSSHNWHRCDQNGGNSRVASVGSPFQIRVVDHVCSASRREY
ncbi:Auxin efflux carrier, partial [Cynara cardunculus var. scolymus]